MSTTLSWAARVLQNAIRDACDSGGVLGGVHRGAMPFGWAVAGALPALRTCAPCRGGIHARARHADAGYTGCVRHTTLNLSRWHALSPATRSACGAVRRHGGPHDARWVGCASSGSRTFFPMRWGGKQSRDPANLHGWEAAPERLDPSHLQAPRSNSLSPAHPAPAPPALSSASSPERCDLPSVQSTLPAASILSHSLRRAALQQGGSAAGPPRQRRRPSKPPSAELPAASKP